MRETKRYEFILRAQTPIAHHAEVFGNSEISMRRKTRQPDGTFAQVPIVTGDTMRHGLREAAAYAVLDAIGMPPLNESALRLLFAGGMITGKGDASTVKLDQYREMVDLVPPLALLGGCAQNRSIPGRMHVEDALLICDESLHVLPQRVLAWMDEHGGTSSCRSHVEEVQRVRMDPSLVPEKRALLTDGGAAIEKRLGKSEAASAVGDALAKDDSKSTMFPRRFETVVAGSLLYWSVQAVCLSDLDVGSLNTMVGAFLSGAVVGGKRATGHGRMMPVEAWGVPIVRPSETASVAFDDAFGVREFREHVAARKERIVSWLAGVEA